MTIKAVNATQLDLDLVAVANSIRQRGGTSASLSFPNGMVDAIAAIPSGGADLPSLTVGSEADVADIRLNKEAINKNGVKIIGTMPDATRSASATKGSTIQQGSVTENGQSKMRNYISVTPKATTTAGYISSGNNSGSAVKVYSTDVTNGNLEITQLNTSIDVADYKTASVSESAVLDALPTWTGGSY